VFVCVCVYLCVFVCVCVCLYLCVFVCVCVRERAVRWVKVRFPPPPSSFRNEGAALGLLVRQLATKSSPGPSPSLSDLGPYLEEFATGGREPNRTDETSRPCADETSEAKLRQWATDNGIVSLVEDAPFTIGTRGGMARIDIQPGDIVLSVPITHVINVNTAFQSYYGSVFKAIQERTEIDDETVVLLFCLVDRFDEDSSFRAMWESLPVSHCTAYSFSSRALEELQGTPLDVKISELRDKLRTMYDKLFPWLSEVMPQVFPPEIATWEHFLWMAELWFSYPFSIEYEDGSTMTTLLPVVQVRHITYVFDQSSLLSRDDI